MSKLPLSVIILNHRADARLDKCLRSVVFADEIMVLDDNSQQNWSKYPHVKVVPLSCPVDDFGAVRNQGLEVAKHEWVLFLDSDEYLGKDAEATLVAEIMQEKIDGWWLQRLDLFAGKMLEFGETGHIYFLRLFRKKTAHFERTVHEFAVVAGETGNSKVLIFHQPHRTVTEFIDKVNHYAFLEAQSRPKHTTLRWLSEIILYPPGKFVFNYFFKLGCLDGWRGLVYAYCMSLHSLLVRIYLYEKQHPQ